MGFARVNVPMDALRTMLRLPENCEISLAPSGVDGAIGLRLSSPDLPTTEGETPQGELVIEVQDARPGIVAGRVKVKAGAVVLTGQQFVFPQAHRIERKGYRPRIVRPA